MRHAQSAVADDCDVAVTDDSSAGRCRTLKISGVAAATLDGGRMNKPVRAPGSEGFAVVGFATTGCGYLALSKWALNDIGARAVAKTPHEAGFVGASVIAVKLILATTGWLILVLVFSLLRLPQEARPWLHTIGITAGTTDYNKRKPKAIALQQQEIDDKSRKSRDSQYPPNVTDHGRGHAWRQDK